MALSELEVATRTKVHLHNQMAPKGPLSLHQKKGSKPHPEGCTFCSVLCPGCRTSDTLFGKLHSSLGDGGTSQNFRALHRISSGNGYKTCCSALQELFALESAVENENIQDNSNSGMILAADNIKGKKSKLKDQHILLIKIFLSLLHKLLLSGFYILVVFKITSGTNLLHK